MAGFPHHQLDSYLGKLIAAGLSRGRLRAGRGPQAGQGAGQARGDPRRHARHADRRRPARPAREQLPGRGLPRRTANGGRGRPGLGRAVDRPVPGRRVSRRRSWPTSWPASARPSACCREEADPLPTDLREADADHAPARLGVLRRTARRQALTKHFGTAGLEGFGFDATDDAGAIRAAGAMLDYLQRDAEDVAGPHRPARSLPRGQRAGDRRGHAPQPGDHPHHPRRPPRGLAAGRARPHRHGDGLAAAGRLAGQPADRLGRDRRPAGRGRGAGRRTAALCAGPARSARGVYDIERLLARVTTGRASPRDLSFIGRTLGSLPPVKAKLTGRQAAAAATAGSRPRPVPRRCARSSTRRWSTTARWPLATAASSATASSAELDELRELAARRQAVDRPTTRPTRSSRLGHPQPEGRLQQGLRLLHRGDQRPPRQGARTDYIRKQTLKNAERYITPELKEYEEKVLTADEKAKDLEYELFRRAARRWSQRPRARLQATAAVLAQLDVLAGAGRAGPQARLLPPASRRRAACWTSSTAATRCSTCIEPEGTFVPNDTAARRRTTARSC